MQSYEQQFRAVARHLDVKTDIAMLQKAGLDAMIVSMREVGFPPGVVLFSKLQIGALHRTGGVLTEQA